jgi:uncharacterized repeat protein (TIGR03803 family)
MNKSLLLKWLLACLLIGASNLSYAQRLAGMTSSSADNAGSGTIFQIDADGANSASNPFSALADGASPEGDLIEVDGVLYGTVENGGNYDAGIIFSVNLDGTNFTILHHFDYETGGGPDGGLVYVEGVFYGMTDGGSGDSDGVIYKYDPNGDPVYTVMHNFDCDFGCEIEGDLIYYDGALYGMTTEGGEDDDGVVFSITLDVEPIYSVLHNFDEDNGDEPDGSLLEVDGTLYGLTEYGGSNDDGVIFSLTTGASPVYTVLHHFNESTDGGYPNGTLIEDGGILYGTTDEEGEYGYGTVYSITTTGTDFTVLHSFDGESGEGVYPTNKLFKSGNILYGVTTSGGENDLGTVYSLTQEIAGRTTIDIITYTYADEFHFTEEHGYGRTNLLLGSDDNLYFINRGNDDIDDRIARKETSLKTSKKNKQERDRNEEEKDKNRRKTKETTRKTRNTPLTVELHKGAIIQLDADFNASIIKYFKGNLFPSGANPDGELLKASDGKLYGMTRNGGGGEGVDIDTDNGVIFRTDLDGSNFELLKTFDETTGTNPYGSLMEYNGYLYGTTFYGGDNGYGTIFRVDMADFDTGFEVLFHFDFDNNGYQPYGKLIAAGDGYLYGTVANGIMPNYNGGIYRINPSATDVAASFEIVVEGNSSNGTNPVGSLMKASDGNLYGTMRYGGSMSSGTIFQLTTGEEPVYTVIKNFTYDDGYGPISTLLEAEEGVLYGTTSGGGEDSGVFFKIEMASPYTYTVLHHFYEEDGASPRGSLAKAGGKIYGTTSYGGANYAGVLYSLTMSDNTYTIIANFEEEGEGGRRTSSIITELAGSYPEGGVILVSSLADCTPITGLSAESGTGAFTLSWDAKEGAVSYTVKVYYAGTTTLAYSGTTTSNSWSKTGVIATNYTWTIEADTDGECEEGATFASGEQFAVFACQEGFTSTSSKGGINSFEVIWTSVPNVTSYTVKIYYENGTLFYTFSTASTIIQGFNVPDGNYFWTVTINTGCGASIVYGGTFRVLSCTVMNNLTGLSSIGGNKSFKLSWTALAGDFTGLYRYSFRARIKGTTTWTYTGRVSGTSYTRTSVTAGTYEWELQASLFGAPNTCIGSWKKGKDFVVSSSGAVAVRTSDEVFETDVLAEGIEVINFGAEEEEVMTETSLDFTVFPNPSRGIVSFNLGSFEGVGKLEIYNLMGQVIYSQEVSAGELIQEKDFSAQAKGMYIVRLSANGNVQTQKFVIE